MTKMSKLNPIAGAVGATLVATLAAAPMASAASNPFAATDIGSGYMVADAHIEGKCGGDKSKKEGQCGEGKCGGKK